MLGRYRCCASISVQTRLDSSCHCYTFSFVPITIWRGNQLLRETTLTTPTIFPWGGWQLIWMLRCVHITCRWGYSIFCEGMWWVVGEDPSSYNWFLTAEPILEFHILPLIPDIRAYPGISYLMCQWRKRIMSGKIFSLIRNSIRICPFLVGVHFLGKEEHSHGN